MVILLTFGSESRFLLKHIRLREGSKPVPAATRPPEQERKWEALQGPMARVPWPGCHMASGGFEPSGGLGGGTRKAAPLCSFPLADVVWTWSSVGGEILRPFLSLSRMVWRTRTPARRSQVTWTPSGPAGRGFRPPQWGEFVFTVFLPSPKQEGTLIFRRPELRRPEVTAERLGAFRFSRRPGGLGVHSVHSRFPSKLSPCEKNQNLQRKPGAIFHNFEA